MKKGYENIEQTTTPNVMLEPTKETPVIEEAEKPIVNEPRYQVKYRRVVYLGVADTAERVGMVTGAHYIFGKDNYKMPVAIDVDERDYPSIVAEKGKGCARRSPDILFMSETEWRLEVEQARLANSK